MTKHPKPLIVLFVFSSVLLICGCSTVSTSENGQSETIDPNNKPLNFATGHEAGTANSAWVSANGTEYQILAIGELYFSNEKEQMITIKYLSKDPSNESIREKEFSDLYPLAARKLNLEGFDLVGLIAVDKPPISFGIQRVSGYRDMKSVEEVKQLAEKP